jgi:hypothetical protein
MASCSYLIIVGTDFDQDVINCLDSSSSSSSSSSSVLVVQSLSK